MLGYDDSYRISPREFERRENSHVHCRRRMQMHQLPADERYGHFAICIMRNFAVRKYHIRRHLMCERMVNVGRKLRSGRLTDRLAIRASTNSVICVR